MSQSLLAGVTELKWNEAQKYAKQGCSELYDILCQIDPGPDLTFIRATYPFGTIIMHDDELYLPTDDYLSEPLSSENIPTNLKDKLGYRSIPFGIIVKNQVEVFREFNNRIFSVELSAPNKGLEIGVFEYFGLTPCYTVTSGARSLLMVPKISESRSHSRLIKHYNVNCIAPNTILKGWQVFKALYTSPKFETKWESEILYLSRSWDDMLKKHGTQEPWSKLKDYLFKKGFEHSQLGRNRLVLDVLWQQVSADMKEEGYKTDPYVIDTMKHLIYLFIGGTSGYRPATDDYAGPIREIQQAYLDIYGLTQVPTIMRPYRYSVEDNIPIYYSLQTPSMISSTPTSRKTSALVDEMRELIDVKNILGKSHGNVRLNGYQLEKLIKSIKLQFYHGDRYSHGRHIRPTSELIETDSDFTPQHFASYGLEPISEGSSFVRGCIRLSKEESND